MGFLVHKQKGVFFNKISRLAAISLIATLSFAFVDTIWAVFINSFLDSALWVSLFSAALTLVAFISYFLFIPLMEKKDKAKIYSWSLFLFAAAYILFAINPNFYVFVVMSFIIVFVHSLRITSFGIIVRDASERKKLSGNEGLMYTFANIAWLLGPLVSGFISDRYNISLVFILSAIFVMIAFFLFNISGIKDIKKKKRIDKNFYKNFRDFFKSKDRVLSYILGGGVNYWWNLIYLFVPLLIIKSLHVLWVGYFLFAIAIPIIFTQYYFSRLAGKIGFKKIFKIGYIIPAIFAILCFFTSNIFLIMIYLVLASFGLAMLEATTEAYFCDILKGKQDLRFYGPYNTTINVNHFISRILTAIVLFFLPFRFIFILFGLSMFIFFLISFKVRNIVESRHNGKRR